MLRPVGRSGVLYIEKFNSRSGPAIQLVMPGNRASGAGVLMVKADGNLLLMKKNMVK